MQLSITDLLNYTTVRIETITENGEGAGTGFFFKFNESDKGFIPVIITNKHVVRGAKYGSFYLTPKDENNNPIDTEKKRLSFRNEFENFEDRWKFHPDDDVDLCVMGFTDVAYLFNKKFKNYPFVHFLNKTMIPNEEILKRFSTIEDIYMVGYPNGLWDEYNNKPFIRKGITSTSIAFDYNGKKEFAIDMACFPGSSGSLILIINRRDKLDKFGRFFDDIPPIVLIGILYAGPLREIETYKEEEITEIYLKDMLNLGFAIKSDRVLELEEYFLK